MPTAINSQRWLGLMSNFVFIEITVREVSLDRCGVAVT